MFFFQPFCCSLIEMVLQIIDSYGEAASLLRSIFKMPLVLFKLYFLIYGLTEDATNAF